MKTSVVGIAILLLTLFEHGQGERLMFAHYYLSATQDYDSWPSPEFGFKWDIKNAVKAGLDGFVLNVGGQSWELDRVDQMYVAASTFKNFKLFVNLDLTYPVNTDPNHMISVLKRNLDSEAQFRIDQRPVFGTYMGQNLTFGEKDRVVGWTKHFIEPLKLQNISVYFMPYWPLRNVDFFDENFFVDAYQSFDAWPMKNREVDYELDKLYISYAHASRKKVMSSVSPGFFAHGPKNNLIHRSEDIWHMRWNQLINNDADFGQIISWNGFEFSHAVGPINRHSSHAEFPWYTDLKNEAFTRMLPFFVQWFKSRKQPPLTENVIYIYHRPQSKWSPNVLNDPVPKPANWDHAKDAFVVMSFIKDQGPYEAEIVVGNRASKYTKFVLNKGIEEKEIPFPPWAGDVFLTVRRHGSELNRTKSPTQIQAWGEIQAWNFNFDSRFITF